MKAIVISFLVTLSFLSFSSPGPLSDFERGYDEGKRSCLNTIQNQIWLCILPEAGSWNAKAFKGFSKAEALDQAEVGNLWAIKNEGLTIDCKQL